MCPLLLMTVQHFISSQLTQTSSSKEHKNAVFFLFISQIVKALSIHAPLSHKMALALCAKLAHLSVLKLSSELHGGGTGRVQTLGMLRTAPPLDERRPSNTPANHNSRLPVCPARF